MSASNRLTALLDKYGAPDVRRYMRELTVRAEQLMRAYIAKIPDGVIRSIQMSILMALCWSRSRSHSI